MKLLCPSAPCESGALIVGRVQSNASVKILPEPFQISSEFVQTASEQADPELRFRFAAPCRKLGCIEWNGRCQVVVRALSHLGETAPVKLEECGIRSQCRWFQQSGPPACAVCSRITRKPVSLRLPEAT